MVLASIYFEGELKPTMLFRCHRGHDIITSIIGTFFVRLGASKTSWALSTRVSSRRSCYRPWVWPLTDYLIGMRTAITSGGNASYPDSALLLRARRAGVTGALIWITEYYTRHELPPGARRRAGLGDRAWHQCHPGLRSRGSTALPARHLRRHRRYLRGGGALGIAIAVSDAFAHME